MEDASQYLEIKKAIATSLGIDSMDNFALVIFTPERSVEPWWGASWVGLNDQQRKTMAQLLKVMAKDIAPPAKEKP